MLRILKFLRLDWLVLIPIILLLSISILMLSSIAPELAGQQLLFSVTGMALYFLVSSIEISLYYPLGKYFWILSIVLLLTTAIVGAASHGSVRWLDIAGARIQTSELTKPLLILSFASLLVRYSPSTIRKLIIHIILMVLPSVLIFRQPDLGSALVLSVVWVGMIFMAGVPLRFVAVACLLFGLLVPLSWEHLAEYQKLRVLTFIDPWKDPLGSGYSVIQSVIAVGSGRFLGRGLGRGVQSQLKFLPEHYTDFIFASLAEELGFLGSLVVLAMYVILLFNCFKMSFRCSDQFKRLIILGVALLLILQVSINIGMNMGIVPVTGITLPFISYGGSSIWSLWICFGLVSSVKRSLRFTEIDTEE